MKEKTIFGVWRLEVALIQIIGNQFLSQLLLFLFRITREWKTAETQFLAKLFIYLSSIISLIRDVIYRMVTIFRFDHMIGENQQ